MRSVSHRVIYQDEDGNEISRSDLVSQEGKHYFNQLKKRRDIAGAKRYLSFLLAVREEAGDDMARRETEINSELLMISELLKQDVIQTTHPLFDEKMVVEKEIESLKQKLGEIKIRIEATADEIKDKYDPDVVRLRTQKIMISGVVAREAHAKIHEWIEAHPLEDP